jgi:hypothetical protein
MLATKTVTGTGAVTDARTRIKGLIITCGATAGTLTFTNGSGGAVVSSITTPGGNQTIMPPIPEDGLLFPQSCYCSAATNVTNVTLFVQ